MTREGSTPTAKDPSGRIKTWIAANPIPAVTLAGLLLYGSLRFANGIFYGRLGFRPEDVGLNYPETIAGVIAVLILLAILRVIAGFAAALSVATVRFVQSRNQHQPVSFFKTLDGTAGTALYRLGQLKGLGLYVFIALIAPIGFAIGGARDAANGQPTGSGVFDFPFHAEAAIVHIDGSFTKSVPDGTCVLYLGQSDGVLALYDPATGTSWRVSTGAATVETGGRLANVQLVPNDCPHMP